MLLITDHVEQSRSLQRTLALWGPCTVIDLDEKPKNIPKARRLVVTNVELSNKSAVDSIRAALAKYRGPGTPCLCLLRDPSPRATLQANAIGATTILPEDAPKTVLLETISQILHADETAGSSVEASAQIHGHVVAATAALADMLEAAAGGRTLPLGAINSSVESINQAADSADIGAWLEVVWHHDDLTYQHCLLVAGLTAAFARQLGFATDDRRLLTCAAVLHDIGKAKIPLEILHKPGKLTEAEWEVMRRHPQLGYEMLLSQGGFAKEIVEAARNHHEYLDGSGYPDRLRGEQISDVVRMITICDIYAALIERRSYKEPMPPEAAYSALLEMGGKLDADLLRAFKRVILTDAAPGAPAGVSASSV